MAGAFAVLIALGTEGTEAALIMAVVSLLANSVLQQLIQPFVMGATLSLNPLVVLIVTIGAGALFGMVGLTLAAPLTSAAVHISNELRNRSDGVGVGGESSRRPRRRAPSVPSGPAACRPAEPGGRRSLVPPRRQKTPSSWAPDLAAAS